MFQNPFENAFGIDMSDRSIKIVQLRNVTGGRRSAAFRYKTHRETRLPEGLIENGELKQPETVRKYLMHLLRGDGGRRKKIRGDWAVVSVPAAQSYLRHLQIAKPPTDIIEEDVLIAAQKHIPFSEDEYYIDWQIVNSQDIGDTTDVLIAAIQKNVADGYTDMIESTGLGVLALEVEDLAVARALITHGKVYEGEARAVLNLGEHKSSLILYDHDIIQFSMSLTFSGFALTKALSTGLKITMEEAERRKKRVGADYKKGKGAQFTITKKMLDSLATDIKKGLAFYDTHFIEPNLVTHITMAGGSANVTLLGEYLSQKLGIEAAPGHIWKNLHTTKKLPKDSTQHLSLATAIGLALRAADNPSLTRDII